MITIIDFDICNHPSDYHRLDFDGSKYKPLFGCRQKTNSCQPATPIFLT